MTTEQILRISRIIVIVAIAGVLGWDLFAQLRGGTGAPVCMMQRIALTRHARSATTLNIPSKSSPWNNLVILAHPSESDADRTARICLIERGD